MHPEQELINVAKHGETQSDQLGQFLCAVEASLLQLDATAERSESQSSQLAEILAIVEANAQRINASAVQAETHLVKSAVSEATICRKNSELCKALHVAEAKREEAEQLLRHEIAQVWSTSCILQSDATNT